MSEVKQQWLSDDKTPFNTKAEAEQHNRLPVIMNDLIVVADGQEKLAKWILDCQKHIKELFALGKVKRVTKSDRNRLQRGLKKLSEIHEDRGMGVDVAWIVENSEALVKGFKWPGQKRLKDEELQEALQEKASELTNGDQELATWIIASKDAILKAYEAGKPKREISEKAVQGLAAYRAKMAQQKAAAQESAPENS